MSPERLTERQLREDPEIHLRNFTRTKTFLVIIDTDGCITDNMNGKQILIFHPHFMEFFNLWEIESYFREVTEYYNLFSAERGCNRFVAISLTIKALAKREDVKVILKEKNINLPDIDTLDIDTLDGYINYCKENKLGLGNPSLEKYIILNPTNFFLYKLLGWSEAVNRTFPHISAKIPPFEGVEESLKLMAEHTDIIVVSKTPYEDLANYWQDQGIDKYVQVIAGQEMGSKGYHIEVVKKAGGYLDDEVLMLGDGNGDLKAVKQNRGLFYPISPGKEQEAWNNFSKAFKKFTGKEYKGKFEDSLLDIFNKSILNEPLWEKTGYDHIKAYREKQPIRKALYKEYNPGGRLCVL